MMLANCKTLSNDLYDPDTGQQLFHPVVGRAPQQPRPQAGPATSDHLYKAALVSKYKKMTAQAEREIKKQQDANMVFTCASTKKIVEKKKFTAFAQIFEWLDSDRDGHISADKIDISPLSADMLEVLSPLFMEMEELSQALDAEEFIDAVGRLYDSLSLPQKNILLLKPDRRERSQSNKRKHDPGHQFQVSSCCDVSFWSDLLVFAALNQPEVKAAGNSQATELEHQKRVGSPLPRREVEAIDAQSCCQRGHLEQKLLLPLPDAELSSRLRRQHSAAPAKHLRVAYEPATLPRRPSHRLANASPPADPNVQLDAAPFEPVYTSTATSRQREQQFPVERQRAVCSAGRTLQLDAATPDFQRQTSVFSVRY